MLTKPPSRPHPKQAQDTMKRFPDKTVTAKTRTMKPSATPVERIRRFVTSISMAERVRGRSRSAPVHSRIGRTAPDGEEASDPLGSSFCSEAMATRPKYHNARENEST